MDINALHPQILQIHADQLVNDEAYSVPENEKPVGLFISRNTRIRLNHMSAEARSARKASRG
jgi:hypothetical protein